MVEPILPPPLPESLPPDRVAGITTTVPIEVICAAGLLSVDLNNLFISHPDPLQLVEGAERSGFPRTCCCWTKGIYGAVRALGLSTVVGVTRGDCSNAEAMLEVLADEGVRCVAFDYPRRQDAGEMARAVEELAAELDCDVTEAEEWRERLTWSGSKVSGWENHLWLVSASDFCADPQRYRAEAEAFVQAAQARPPIGHHLRLGVCGIPPIVPELYRFLEDLGALVVYNETQRQFAMPEPASSLAEQYSRYTYPYGVFPRVADILAECERRRLDGLIHYVQSFCHRRIEDRIIRRHVPVPILTLEADRPEPLSGQLRTRLEAFVQMLEARKQSSESC